MSEQVIGTKLPVVEWCELVVRFIGDPTGYRLERPHLSGNPMPTGWHWAVTGQRRLLVNVDHAYLMEPK